MRRRTFTIATRGSALALRQAEEVQQSLQRAHPDLEFVLRRIASQGDLQPDTSLSILGGQGVFVKAIEQALLEGAADIAVHSLKDMPGEEDPRLAIAALPPREDPRDALISPWEGLAAIPFGGSVATGSPRRAAQLLAVRPDLQIVDIRGNVDTRLRKLREEGLDGLVLALAGLRRLGREEEVAEILDTSTCLPAPGQGALAVQVRQIDDVAHSVVSALDDADTRRAVLAERSFLRRLGAGCRLPVAALGRVEGDLVVLDGLVASVDGGTILRREARGSNPEDVAGELFNLLMADGAGVLLTVRGVS